MQSFDDVLGKKSKKVPVKKAPVAKGIEVKVSITLKSCRACNNSSHSGGFTVRGARVICGHSDACEVRKTREELAVEYPEYVKDYAKCDWKNHWYNRVTDNVIPKWCPLLHGSRY